MNQPKPGEVYKHHKGNEYVVIALAKHTEKPSLQLVVYTESKDRIIRLAYRFLLSLILKDVVVWARPLGMFTQKAGKDLLRFKKVDV